ncbi:Fic family protein [Corynebacterium sp. 13CS0277]|uniref:Fic family protein n=1 Tax=Corynebacterium sp. 13CS0277 TaxID=2071994 RepID=UPI0011B21551|nr:Fic family protein [Corynebacterium sp. 13CS0277]
MELDDFRLSSPNVAQPGVVFHTARAGAVTGIDGTEYTDVEVRLRDGWLPTDDGHGAKRLGVGLEVFDGDEKIAEQVVFDLDKGPWRNPKMSNIFGSLGTHHLLSKAFDEWLPLWDQARSFLPDQAPNDLSDAMQKRWEAYLDPVSGDLANKVGIYGETWATVEANLVAQRALEVPLEGFRFAKAWDNLAATHEHLFKYCYEWAGKPREVDLAKPNPFADTGQSNYCPVSAMPEWVSIVEDIEARLFATEDLEDKVTLLAQMHATLNYIHPFRDGNGRAIRTFMEQEAATVGVFLDWESADSEVISFTSIASLVGRQGPEEAPFISMYRDIAEDMDYAMDSQGWELLSQAEQERDSATSAPNLSAYIGEQRPDFYDDYDDDQVAIEDSVSEL